MTYNEENNWSVQTNSELKEMIELSVMHYNTVIITILHTFKKPEND